MSKSSIAVIFVLVVGSFVWFHYYSEFITLPLAPKETKQPDIAVEAIKHLRETKPFALSGSLTELLAKEKPNLVSTEMHPLIGKKAPEIRLLNSDDQEVELSAALKRGPVVLVFYLGYACDHCVSQLFGLNEDLKYFDELNATVIAISEDHTTKTREKFKKYGSFRFPVLSDPTHEIAMRYGVYNPASNGRRVWEAHGTFVIDPDQTIRWVNTGPEPFVHNATILNELVQIRHQPQQK